VRVLVLCAVHDPRDARIAEREIAALLAAGHEVTQAGPFSAYGAVPRDGVRGIDIPRATGRRRLGALRESRRVLRREAASHDVVILHSAEAVAAATGLRHPSIVWDVHEDTAASLSLKPWLPNLLRRPVAGLARAGESLVERRRHLLLAETAYAHRFGSDHPVVPNSPVVPARVPASGRGRAIYVGSVTVARGGDDLIALSRRLTTVSVDVVGPATGDLVGRLRAAEGESFHWWGFRPNAEALAQVEGATVGLSLLHDEPNYRHSMPTKVLEYLARGVPFISTPLPLAVDVAEQSGAGVIVPFGDLDAAAVAVQELNDDDARRQAMAEAGRAWVRANADWANDGPAFVAILESWARG
jgi:glycosyltransferase involved in cell wall biosynthesis